MSGRDEQNETLRSPGDDGDETRPVASGETSRPPDRLGDYLVGAFLGKGAMGRVHKARHQKTGATVVIKFVPLHERGVIVEALRAEVAGLATLSVPNVPKVLDTGIDQGVVWFAQEYIDGVDLGEILHRRRDGESSFHVDFDDQAAEGHNGAPPPGLGAPADELPGYVAWFRDLAFALENVHRAGLLHRDIKPANIMLAQGRVPYLIDFGLSIQASASEAMIGRPAGTLPYMSPEQAGLGWAGLGPASDIYGLAITFHELLTGERVVKSRDRAAIVREILHQDVPRPSRVNGLVPRSLDPIFLRATAKKVEDRYSDAGELGRDLDDWLRPPSAGRRLRQWSVDHPRLVWLAGLVLLMLLVLGFVLAPGSEDPWRAERGRLGALVGRPEAAANALDALPDQLDDASWREAMGPLVGELVEVGAAARTVRLISEVCFTLAVPERPTPWAEAGATAARLVGRVPDCPDLHWQVAFDRYMAMDSVAADAAIERGLECCDDPRDHRRLLTLRLAVARQGGADATMRRLIIERDRIRIPSSLSDDSQLELCIDVLGLLFAPEPDAEALRGQLSLLEAAFAGGREIAARSLHARVLLALGQARAAYEAMSGLEDLFDRDTSAAGVARRLGLESYQILAGFLASLDDSAESSFRRAEITRRAARFLAERPRQLDWFCDRLCRSPALDRPTPPQQQALLDFLAGVDASGLVAGRPRHQSVYDLASRASDLLAVASDLDRLEAFAGYLDTFAPAPDAFDPDGAELAWRRYRDHLRYGVLRALNDPAADPSVSAVGPARQRLERIGALALAVAGDGGFERLHTALALAFESLVRGTIRHRMADGPGPSRAELNDLKSRLGQLDDPDVEAVVRRIDWLLECLEENG
ncbi:MAG: serine/threonine protein kinase [Planctomycetes bacterium]|nr:serine/threonine protein kinase [Planctomycetota bacterium]